MTRRAVCAAVVGALLAAPAAVGAQRLPVQGGGSFNDAPILEPGLYRDTIRAGETLYYGFDMGVGQRARITAKIHPVTNASGPVNVLFRSQLYGPNRAPDVFTNPFGSGAGIEKVTVRFTSGRVGDLTSDVLASPGTFFVSLNLADAARVFGRKEFKTDLEIEVLGTAAPSPTASPTGDPSPTPEETPTEAKGAASDTPGASGDELETAELPVRAYLISFIACFLLAAALQFGRSLRRRAAR
jgi:hypothetical protein